MLEIMLDYIMISVCYISLSAAFKDKTNTFTFFSFLFFLLFNALCYADNILNYFYVVITARYR